MESEISTPVQSAASTPGAPLFSFRYNTSVSQERPSKLDWCNCLTVKIDRCKCFPPEVWGANEPVFQRSSAISLSKKVYDDKFSLRFHK